MLKIRLSRTGFKNHPAYRIVVAPVRSKLTGSPIDLLGYYNPTEKRLSIDKKKVNAWISKGVQITPMVSKLLRRI